MPYRELGGGVPEFWGRKSKYTEGTDFLGTPPNHMDLVRESMRTLFFHSLVLYTFVPCLFRSCDRSHVIMIKICPGELRFDCADKRPLSPDVFDINGGTMYHFPITAVTSILNRVTGVVLSGGPVVRSFIVTHYIHAAQNLTISYSHIASRCLDSYGRPGADRRPRSCRRYDRSVAGAVHGGQVRPRLPLVVPLLGVRCDPTALPSLHYCATEVAGLNITVPPSLLHAGASGTSSGTTQT